jgi:hypothetical protein
LSYTVRENAPVNISVAKYRARFGDVFSFAPINQLQYLLPNIITYLKIDVSNSRRTIGIEGSVRSIIIDGGNTICSYNDSTKGEESEPKATFTSVSYKLDIIPQYIFFGNIPADNPDYATTQKQDIATDICVYSNVNSIYSDDFAIPYNKSIVSNDFIFPGQNETNYIANPTFISSVFWNGIDGDDINSELKPRLITGDNNSLYSNYVTFSGIYTIDQTTSPVPNGTYKLQFSVNTINTCGFKYSIKNALGSSTILETEIGSYVKPGVWSSFFIPFTLSSPTNLKISFTGFDGLHPRRFTYWAGPMLTNVYLTKFEEYTPKIIDKQGFLDKLVVNLYIKRNTAYTISILYNKNPRQTTKNPGQSTDTLKILQLTRRINNTVTDTIFLNPPVFVFKGSYIVISYDTISYKW